jgi:hypothetical protein
MGPGSARTSRVRPGGLWRVPARCAQLIPIIFHSFFSHVQSSASASVLFASALATGLEAL